MSSHSSSSTNNRNTDFFQAMPEPFDTNHPHYVPPLPAPVPGPVLPLRPDRRRWSPFQIAHGILTLLLFLAVISLAVVLLVTKRNGEQYGAVHDSNNTKTFEIVDTSSPTFTQPPPPVPKTTSFNHGPVADPFRDHTGPTTQTATGFKGSGSGSNLAPHVSSVSTQSTTSWPYPSIIGGVCVPTNHPDCTGNQRLPPRPTTTSWPYPSIIGGVCVPTDHPDCTHDQRLPPRLSITLHKALTASSRVSGLP